jgi:LITAF-like zinc ribbon domain
MNTEDIVLFQQAIMLANTGHKQQAYKLFCDLHNRGNAEDLTVLYWIAYTTPTLDEARRATETIARLDPVHPKLQELQAYIGGMQQSMAYAPPPGMQQSMAYAPSPGMFAPALQCPYCHYTGPVSIRSKISTGGWVFFIVFLVFFFPICWIGFLIKKDYYACASCGIAFPELSY